MKLVEISIYRYGCGSAEVMITQTQGQSPDSDTPWKQLSFLKVAKLSAYRWHLVTGAFAASGRQPAG